MSKKSGLLELILKNSALRNGKVTANTLFITAAHVVCDPATCLKDNKDIALAFSKEIESTKKVLAEKITNITCVIPAIDYVMQNYSLDDFYDSLLMEKATKEIESEKGFAGIITTDNLIGKIISKPTSFIIAVIDVANHAEEYGIEQKNTAPIDNLSAEDDIYAIVDMIKSSFLGDEKKSSSTDCSDLKFTDLSVNDGFIFNKPDKSESKKDEKNDGSKGDLSKKQNVMTLPEIMDSVDNVRKVLKENVYGQDHAISAFVSGYFQAEVSALAIEKRNKPRATFLFAGPPGVGKTYLAETAANALGLPYLRVDMSEYSDKESAMEFSGSDNAYKDSSGGIVTGFVNENPHCIILFDEVEKAHLNVIHLLLQLLDAGRLRDSNTDKEVSFTDAILIFTTNVGKDLYEDDTVNLTALSRKAILSALSKETHPLTGAYLFPAAICSRFSSGNVVMFNHLEPDNLLKVCEKEIKRHASSIAEKTGIQINIDQHIPFSILYEESTNADARTIKGKSALFMYSELYELFRLMRGGKSVYDIKELKSIDFKIDKIDDPEIAKFFKKADTPSVLLFGNSDLVSDCRKKLSGMTTFCADTFESAKEIVKGNSVDCILCDITFKPYKIADIMNIDDMTSVGKDFLSYAVNNLHLPVYALFDSVSDISDEEIESLVVSGAKDVVYLNGGDGYNLYDIMVKVSEVNYERKRLAELSVANKILTHKTLQQISGDGKHAFIKLYSFSKETAVDAGDNSSMIDGLTRTSVHFSDVIGAEDAKSELGYFVNYLKNPEKFARLGVKAPKGVLLYGPSGTGKTLLAKAMAGESDVTFITAEGNQFIKKYVGEGAQSVHELFKTARKYAPSILFIDEIDAIAKSRGEMSENSHTGDILTAFLTEMDGFKNTADKPVFVLAATNYSVEKGTTRSLDEALLRRFDRCIYIDLPTKEERLTFLELKLSKIGNHAITRDEIENIALRSVGSSLSELDSVFELAMRNLIKSSEYILTDAILEEAFESYNNGDVKKWNDAELTRTARHEAGHALVSRYCGEKPAYLTIVSRSDHGGYMQSDVKEDKGTYTRQELLNRVKVALGGRAAEVVCYGEEDGISTGASADLRHATRIVQAMICDYGMDEQFGLMTLPINTLSGTEFYNKIAERIKEILAAQFESAKIAIKNNKDIFDRLVESLMKNDSLKSDAIEEILKDIKIQ